MGKLTELEIRNLIKAGERFDGPSDGDGLYLRYRKADALAKIEAANAVVTVAALADEYFPARILGRWKHPNIVRSRIERDIKPNIGKLAVGDVRPQHIDAMLKSIMARGAPTMATDVMRWTKRMFDYAVKREMVPYNPAAFDPSDAGGKEESRTRWLTRDELAQWLAASRFCTTWSVSPV